MVDVGAKPETRREALAEGRVHLNRDAYGAIERGTAEKGDVLGVARIAGIQAAKRAAEWIPLAHPLPLESVELDFALEPDGPSVRVTARVAVTARTGVEMEALCAVAGASLTIYDMCKSLDRGMEIDAVRLLRKSGGRSGLYQR